MPDNVARKLIASHRVGGSMEVGQEIRLAIDQTLTQDATGTLVMLELEAMGLDRVRTEVSAQYVDHNLIQDDFRNPDDHLFLRSACRRYGVWYSGPGNGVSHPVHMERFGKPGRSLLGSDSHTPAAGAMGMLAIGAGGLEVALAMAGEPFVMRMPEIWGIRLEGGLPHWVSAKDVILELLRRHGVSAGLGRILEYHGPGLDSLSAMDRHVIANMGAELGATSTVFPADEAVREFLRRQQREEDYEPIEADRGATYDVEETINLEDLEPLIAMPSSPGNVKPVQEVAGEEIYQAYIGSSANPGYRDFAIVAEIVKDGQAAPGVSLDINPTSRQILENLIHDGHILSVIRAGARIHQAGCNGCIGMGQAPASGKYSLRTVPRNFPGRSGTEDDLVCLVSPETAAASALTGRITDPRTLDMPYPEVSEPESILLHKDLLEPPAPSNDIELQKGPNIVELPDFEPPGETLEAEVLLTVGDDISTDEILPAGSRILPYRSNIPKISEFAFRQISQDYAKRAREVGDHAVVAGENYGQGSSREHAALAPRYLGLRLVLAKSFARIHRQNLINFGVLPLELASEEDAEKIEQGHRLRVDRLKDRLSAQDIPVEDLTTGETISTKCDLSEEELGFILAGGRIAWMRERTSEPAGAR